MSRGPTMEEDIALGNIALDLLGQARGLLQLCAAELESDEDRLAYFREAQEFRNPLMCELPNGDFAFTMLRLLFVSAWLADVWPMVDGEAAGVAEKALKENAYHLRHSSAWTIRLGDGTDESHQRMVAAVEALWPYRGELASAEWYSRIEPVLQEATLTAPDRGAWTHRSSADGWHTEHLGYLLADMQSLARAHPEATW